MADYKLPEPDAYRFTDIMDGKSARYSSFPPNGTVTDGMLLFAAEKMQAAYAAGLEAGRKVPEGWKIKKVKGFASPIHITAPNRYCAVVTTMGRNPKNVLYMLAEALLNAAPETKP